MYGSDAGQPVHSLYIYTKGLSRLCDTNQGMDQDYIPSLLMILLQRIACGSMGSTGSAAGVVMEE